MAAVLFGSAYFLMPQFQQRFWELITLDPYGSVVWRFRLWKDMLPVALWQPFFGHGLGTFNELVDYLRGYRFGSLDAHNDYLKIFTELGAAGLGLYVLIISNLLKNLYMIFKKAASEYKTLALGILVIVLAIYGVSAFDNILVATALQWNMWILLGSWLKIGSLKK
jgi:O-antigen ligase